MTHRTSDVIHRNTSHSLPHIIQRTLRTRTSCLNTKEIIEQGRHEVEVEKSRPSTNEEGEDREMSAFPPACAPHEFYTVVCC